MPSKAFMLVALALYSVTAVADPVPPLWTGKSGWLLKAKSIVVHEGTQSAGAIIVEHDARLQRTGILEQTISLKDAAGAEIIIPKGSKAYAADLTLSKDGTPIHSTDSLEWCILPANVTGSVPETICIFREGAQQARYDQYIRTNGLAFQPVQAGRLGMQGPLPDIAEGAVDFGVQFKQQLRIVEITDQGIALESIMSDGTNFSPGQRQTYNWKNNKVLYKSGEDFVVLTRAADGKSVDVMRPAQIPVDRKDVTAVLELLVGTDGRIKDGRVVQSTGNPDADAKIMSEVKRSWQLTPGNKKGKPVEMWGQFTVTIKLED